MAVVNCGVSWGQPHCRLAIQLRGGWGGGGGGGGGGGQREEMEGGKGFGLALLFAGLSS